MAGKSVRLQQVYEVGILKTATESQHKQQTTPPAKLYLFHIVSLTMGVHEDAQATK